jgi:hypothetical protein
MKDEKVILALTPWEAWIVKEALQWTNAQCYDRTNPHRKPDFCSTNGVETKQVRKGVARVIQAQLGEWEDEEEGWGETQFVLPEEAEVNSE